MMGGRMSQRKEGGGKRILSTARHLRRVVLTECPDRVSPGILFKLNR